MAYNIEGAIFLKPVNLYACVKKCLSPNTERQLAHTFSLQACAGVYKYDPNTLKYNFYTVAVTCDK